MSHCRITLSPKFLHLFYAPLKAWMPQYHRFLYETVWSLELGFVSTWSDCERKMISASISSWTFCISQCRSLACPIFACARTAPLATLTPNPKYLEFLLEQYMLINYAWIKQPSKTLSHPISTFQFPTKILFHYPISHPIFLSNQVINSKID